MKINKRIVQLVTKSLIFWVPAVIFLKLAGEVVEREPLPFDQPILYWLHSFASHMLDVVFTTITNLGEPTVLLAIATIMVVYYFVRKQRSTALIVAVAVGGDGVANLVLKLLFHRVRPSLWHQSIIETGFSFPSGHAMVSAAFFAVITYLAWRTKWRIPVIVLSAVLTFVIGTSRLYLGVHYPSDVLAGWSVSIAWVVFIVYLLNGFKQRKQVIPQSI